MKTIFKIILFAVSFVGLLCSILLAAQFFPIPLITNALAGYPQLLPLQEIIFSVFAAVTGLCFIALLPASLLIPGKSAGVIVARAGGMLRLSRQTVESTVRYSFADVGGIGYCHVKAKLKGAPEKTRIRIKLSFSDSERIAELTEIIREKTDGALKTSLGITARLINIEVLGIRRNGAPAVTAAGSRVQ